jgi:thiamine transport system permease protein
MAADPKPSGGNGASDGSAASNGSDASVRSIASEAAPIYAGIAGRTRLTIPPLLLWVLPLVFLAVFFFWPLWTIFSLAGQAALVEGIDPAMLREVWRPLSFTIFQAVLSTLLTLIVGLPAAYVFARFVFPGKGLLRVMTILPFILPTVVVAASFNALLGPRGWVNLLLMQLFHLPTPPVNILNSLAVILLAHVFYNTTIMISVVGTAWEHLDPRLEAAARVLGASTWRAFWEVTLPLLRPALLAALLLVFMFDFTSFGVILLLGGPRFSTIEVEIYIQALQMLNLPLAGLLSAVQLLFTFLLAVAYAVFAGQRSVPLAPRVQGEGMRRAQGWRERLMVGAVILLVIVLLAAPLAALAVRSVSRLEPDRGERAGQGLGGFAPGLTLDYYQELFINRRGSLFYVPPVTAAWNSLRYAGITVVVSLALGLLAASSLTRRSRVNRVLDPLLMLPLGASAVTLGLGFILTFNGPLLNVQSFPWLIPIAHSLVALPFVVRILQPALGAIPGSLRQAASILGASPFQVWREVDLPIIARAALVAAIFSFTISLGEFGATSFLARPEYPTLPVAIYRFLSQPGALNYGQALAMATILMLVCAVSILVLERIRLPGGQGFRM